MGLRNSGLRCICVFAESCHLDLNPVDAVDTIDKENCYEYERYLFVLVSCAL